MGSKRRGSKRASPKEISRKFDETAFRITQERNDFLLPQILDFVEKHKWLNPRPEYQRRLVWDDRKRSAFIESLLLNIPIPPLFLYESDLNRYEVMDGQQRLNAVVDFYQNRFALTGLERWKELNKLKFDDLPERLQRGLDRRRLSATVLLVERDRPVRPGHDDVRKLVFERLNTGGQSLNHQEIRNCLYLSEFNDLLIELAREPMFTKAWDIPLFQANITDHGEPNKRLRTNRLYSRMLDCEIVLRFFAFRHKVNLRGSVRTILDRYMKDHLETSPGDLERLRALFLSRLSLAIDVFGDSTFRYRDDGQWKLSRPLYDAVMCAFDRLWPVRSHIRARRAKVREAVAKLLRNRAAYEVVVGKPNTAKAIGRRIDLVKAAVQKALQR